MSGGNRTEVTEKITFKDLIILVIGGIFSIVLQAWLNEWKWTVLAIIGTILLVFIYFHIEYQKKNNLKISSLFIGLSCLILLSSIPFMFFTKPNVYFQSIYHPSETPTLTPIITQVICNPCVCETPHEYFKPDVVLRDNCIPSGWTTISSNIDKGEIKLNGCWDIDNLWQISGIDAGINFNPTGSTNSVIRGIFVKIPKQKKPIRFTLNINEIFASGNVSPYFFFGDYIPSNNDSITGNFIIYFFDPTITSHANSVGSKYKTNLSEVTPNNDAYFNSNTNYLLPNTEVIISPIDQTHYSIQIGVDNSPESLFKSISYQDGSINLAFGVKTVINSSIDVSVTNLDLTGIFEGQKNN